MQERKMQPEPPTGQSISGSSFALTFGFVALGGMMLLMHPAAERYIIAPFTGLLVVMASALMALFGADVSAVGNVLAFRGSTAAVAVENGCNAVEVCVLLSAAIIAWPASWRARVAGVLVCLVCIQAVNLLRIISLLYLVRFAPYLFEMFHLYVWEAMIMIEALLIFAGWVRHQGGLAIVAQLA